MDPVERVKELTKGLGTDKGCECVGWQAHDPQGHERPNETMNRLVQSVRATGAIGVVGVFVPLDPKSPDPLMKEGRIAFDLGSFFAKGLRVGSGQANVKAYNRELRDLIHAGVAKPSFVISHRLRLDDAPDAYKHFDARDNGWTKVVLKVAA
jgi:threonine dehydrogenase-like Zn-dependent dehydrogenase